MDLHDTYDPFCACRLCVAITHDPFDWTCPCRPCRIWRAASRVWDSVGPRPKDDWGRMNPLKVPGGVRPG
jgi:hypothetical protein